MVKILPYTYVKYSMLGEKVTDLITIDVIISKYYFFYFFYFKLCSDWTYWVQPFPMRTWILPDKLWELPTLTEVIPVCRIRMKTVLSCVCCRRDLPVCWYYNCRTSTALSSHRKWVSTPFGIFENPDPKAKISCLFFFFPYFTF